MSAQEKLEKKDEKQAYNMQLIVFKQGNEEYALPIDQIKEVVITPTVTKMPQTPPYIKGVANIRGNIIAILDLEEKFGIKESKEDIGQNIKNFTLVIESEDIKVGILVKEVPNTLAVSSAIIEEASNLVQDTKSDQSFITGIVKAEKRLIVLIDAFKVIKESEVNSATKTVVP